MIVDDAVIVRVPMVSEAVEVSVLVRVTSDVSEDVLDSGSDEVMEDLAVTIIDAEGVIDKDSVSDGSLDCVEDCDLVDVID